MRVCDIDRNTEVTHEVTITMHPVDGGGEGDHTVTIEAGAAAAKALNDLDWSALHQLTPAGLRKKDPVRSAGAKKGAATRRANSTQPALENAAPPVPAMPVGVMGRPE